MRVLRQLIVALMFLLAVAACGRPPTDTSIRSRVFKLIGAHGMCTAEQVRTPSGKDFILTAGHCRGEVGVDGYAVLEDEAGDRHRAKFLAEDPIADLLVLEGVPGVRGLDIANGVVNHQHVRAFTHGHDYATFKTEGELIQSVLQSIPIAGAATAAEREACSLQKNSIQVTASLFGPRTVCMVNLVNIATTLMIVPGSSGGPAVNDEGQLIGVASATGGGFGFLVPLKDIQRFLAGY